MLRTLRLLLPLAIVALAGAALAAETATPKPIQVSDKVKIKATVEAIDHTNRTVTLKGPKGNTVTLAVDENVKRFDQVKVGDVVTAHYYESVLIEVHKPGEVTEGSTTSGEVARLEGAKPGGAAVVQETVTVTVQAIDLETPAVTVKTLEGESVSFRIKKKENLKGVNVGDKIVVTRTTGLLIAVEEPK